jgi:hypothetical protein
VYFVFKSLTQENPMKKWILLASLALTTIFCTLGAPSAPVSPTADVGSMVNATLTALAASEPAPVETPAPSETAAPVPGTITGKLSYPSEGIPPLRIVAFEVGSDRYHYILTLQNQADYTFELPAGVYHIVAYVMDGSYAGGYTQMVPCGLTAECTDHSLIDVTVDYGATVSGIDPADWYAPADAFPPMPPP